MANAVDFGIGASFLETGTNSAGGWAFFCLGTRFARILVGFVPVRV
jgi:hypothetical protein